LLPGEFFSIAFKRLSCSEAGIRFIFSINSMISCLLGRVFISSDSENDSCVKATEASTRSIGNRIKSKNNFLIMNPPAIKM